MNTGIITVLVKL